MKKIFCFLSFALLGLGCSSDDSEPKENDFNIRINGVEIDFGASGHNLQLIPGEGQYTEIDLSTFLANDADYHIRIATWVKRTGVNKIDSFMLYHNGEGTELKNQPGFACKTTHNTQNAFKATVSGTVQFEGAPLTIDGTIQYVYDAE